MLRSASLLLCIAAVIYGVEGRRGSTSEASSTTTITTESSNRAGNDEMDEMLLDDTEELLDFADNGKRTAAAQAAAQQGALLTAVENSMFCNAEKSDPTKWIQMEDDTICVNQTANRNNNKMGPEFCVKLSSLENASTTSDASWLDPDFAECPADSALSKNNRSIPPRAENLGYGNSWCIVSYDRVANRSLTWSIMGGVADQTIESLSYAKLSVCKQMVTGCYDTGKRGGAGGKNLCHCQYTFKCETKSVIDHCILDRTGNSCAEDVMPHPIVISNMHL